MRALDIKVFRDLGRMRSQMFAIALVIAAGVAVFVSMRTTMKSLREARATWYSEQSFAHVFAGLTRAPEQVARELRSLAGVESLETRVEGWCTLEIPGLVEAATGHIVSLPESGPGAVNRVYLLRGRLPEADDEVLVGEAFFVAQHEKLGSTLSALIAGRQANLKMVGVALSPEFTYSVGPGQMFPDDRRFGVFWMPRKPLAALLDLEGAFNSVALRTHSGAIEHEVLDRVDDILKPYGGVGAIPRALQTSAFFLDNELSQLSTFAVLVPSLFLAVAAFLLNIVFGRLIASQRGDIAALKAFGYRDTEVGVHYGKLLVVIVLVGWLLGVALGAWLGASMTEQYGQYYRFPKLAYHLGGADPTIALLVTLAGALGGTWAALARTVSMPPAEAMRPPSPPVYRRTLLERLGLDRFLAMPVRMVLREFERKPLRSLLSVLGVVMATGLSVVMSSGRDSMDRMLEVQFGRMQREDVHLTLREPRDLQVLSSLSHLPGVERVRGVPRGAGEVDRGHGAPQHVHPGIASRWRDATAARRGLPAHRHPGARPGAGAQALADPRNRGRGQGGSRSARRSSPARGAADHAGRGYLDRYECVHGPGRALPVPGRGGNDQRGHHVGR
ncbi:MAG: ABC transporter permease [Planctomycetota bacterium]